MQVVLVWAYILNAALLIVHEIESAYREEWKLFKLPGGVNFFLLLHLPLVILILFGMVQLQQQTQTGFILSLVLAFAGIFAFGIHTLFIARGDRGFKTPLSLGILIATLAVSIAQAVLTVIAMRA
jgi:uncharacterized membrane-anchored protein